MCTKCARMSFIVLTNELTTPQLAGRHLFSGTCLHGLKLNASMIHDGRWKMAVDAENWRVIVANCSCSFRFFFNEFLVMLRFCIWRKGVHNDFDMLVPNDFGYFVWNDFNWVMCNDFNYNMLYVTISIRLRIKISVLFELVIKVLVLFELEILQ